MSLQHAFEIWFAEGLLVAFLSDTQVMELSVLWTACHLAAVRSSLCKFLTFCRVSL